MTLVGLSHQLHLQPSKVAMQKYTTVHYSQISERFLNAKFRWLDTSVACFRCMPLVKTSADHKLSNGGMGLAT